MQIQIIQLQKAKDEETSLCGRIPDNLGSRSALKDWQRAPAPEGAPPRVRSESFPSGERSTGRRGQENNSRAEKPEKQLLSQVLAQGQQQG